VERGAPHGLPKKARKEGEGKKCSRENWPPFTQVRNFIQKTGGKKSQKSKKEIGGVKDKNNRGGEGIDWGVGR